MISKGVLSLKRLPGFFSCLGMLNASWQEAL